MVLEQRAKNWAYLRKESAFKWRLIKTLSHKRCSSNLKEWLFQRCSTFPKYLEELAWKSEYCNFRQLIWYFLIKRLNARTEIWILNKLLIYLYILHSDEPELEFSCSSRAELWRFQAEPSWGTLSFEPETELTIPTIKEITNFI